MREAHHRLRRHRLHRAADGRAARRAGRAPGAGRALGGSAARAGRAARRSSGGGRRPAPELRVRAGRAGRRAGHHRRAVRQVGRAGRARGDRGRRDYIDSTGEPAFIRRVFEEFGPPAERAGAALLTAMGFDFVPGALAGALALEQAGDAAVRVDVGYYALGGRDQRRDAALGGRDHARGRLRVPRGRAADGADRRAGAHVRRRRARTATRSRSAAPSTSRCRPSIPACARSTSTSAGSRRWRVRSRPAPGRLGRAAPARRARALKPRASASSTSPARPRAARRRACRGSSARPTTPAATGSPRSTCRAASLRAHRRLPRLGRAARRGAGVDGTGALGPVQAFGLDALEAGCREAGPRARQRRSAV